MAMIADLFKVLHKKSKIFKSWFLASRPKTLSIPAVPIFLGTTLASGQVESLSWVLIISLFLSVLFIQIGMNFINDALDFQKGEKCIKGLKLERIELLSNQQFLLGGYTCFFLAFLFGIPLIIEGGWIFAVLLIFSVALGYLYTGGPFPLSYLGISESFILIFYGWISTAAAYYLQTRQLDIHNFLIGTQIGLLSIVPHAINNLRDHIEDALVGKKTLAVRFGSYFACWEVTLCSLTPFILGMFWIEMGQLWMAILPWFVFPLVIDNLKRIWKNVPYSQYNHLLAKSVVCQFLFGIFLALGISLE